ncbi:MAG: hypothetical protein M0C28_05850 [Candidatus Moduliflexus flocculans]|nr:hypothetical protein [Candidatus Moduliflexus flocculans]
MAEALALRTSARVLIRGSRCVAVVADAVRRRDRARSGSVQCEGRVSGAGR